MISKTPRTLTFRYLALYHIYAAVVLLSILLLPLLCAAAVSTAWPRLRLVSPRAASLPPMLLPPVFSLMLLLLSLLRGRYFLPPLPVVVSDTRCWCAADVLRCSAEILLFPPFLPLEPPPLYYPVLRYFLSLFVPPNSRLFRHFYISISRYFCGHFVLSKTEYGVFSTLESSRARDSRRDEAKLFAPSLSF